MSEKGNTKEGLRLHDANRQRFDALKNVVIALGKESLHGFKIEFALCLSMMGSSVNEQPASLQSVGFHAEIELRSWQLGAHPNRTTAMSLRFETLAHDPSELRLLNMLDTPGEPVLSWGGALEGEQTGSRRAGRVIECIRALSHCTTSTNRDPSDCIEEYGDLLRIEEN